VVFTAKLFEEQYSSSSGLPNAKPGDLEVKVVIPELQAVLTGWQ